MPHRPPNPRAADLPDYSVLDLVPVRQGGTISEAMADCADLARCAEAAGCKRIWVAEHHGMEGIAGGATSVVLAHLGNATASIRLGAGGIMLPNHNPFVIAEQFGTLDALFPHRVDLGLGRAPGADGRIAQALRKDLMRASEFFPQDVVELRALFAGDPSLPIQATAAQGAEVEMWVLGSSLFGASLAAALGLPYAFASHFAPDHLDAALKLYRERFTPSVTLAAPHVMAAMTMFCAPSDEEAEFLASTQEQAFVALRFGEPGRMKLPIENYRASLPPAALAMLERMDVARAVGSPDRVRQQVAAFAQRTGADEIIFSGQTYDSALRRRSLELAMTALQGA